MKIWNVKDSLTLPSPESLDTIRSLRDMPDPNGLPDMAVAVQTVLRAVDSGAKILVYGDYDLDGISGASLLFLALDGLDANASYYIPDRLKDGYGLRAAAALGDDEEDRPALVITVDNGVSAGDEIAILRAQGVKVIVTDHHTLPAQLPDCAAIVHPGRPEAADNVRGLCGAGVAWFLAYALHRERKTGAAGQRLLKDLLDLAALGTVADVVPLTGINRLIVKEGLRLIQTRRRPGLAALLNVAGIGADREILASTIAFQLAPRLNAAGRIGDASDAARLLTDTDQECLTTLARVLDYYNSTRKDLVAKALTEVAPGHCVQYSPSWEPGIGGVIAGRLCEQTALPAVVICLHDGKGHGSCRAPAGFNLLEPLTACADLLVRYGGHAQAAGLSILPENLEAFRARFEAFVVGVTLPPPTLEIAGVLPLSSVTDAMLSHLAVIEPYGAGNPQPVFASGLVEVTDDRPLGSDGKHRALTLRQGTTTFRAVWFGGGSAPLPSPLEVAFKLGYNEWRGRRTIQLEIVDARKALAISHP